MPKILKEPELSNQMNYTPLIYEGVEFKILFSKDNWFKIEFQQVDQVTNLLHPSQNQQLQGILRFDKIEDGIFQITLVQSLYDMISRNMPDVDEKYHIEANVNGIKFECRQSSYLTEHNLHIKPISVDEEGWLFVFTQANAALLGKYELGQVSATKIIRDILTASETKWTLTSHNRSERDVYEKTKQKGVVSHIASIQFPFMSIFRERFVQAFGIELLELAAAERGFEIGQELRRFAKS